MSDPTETRDTFVPGQRTLSIGKTLSGDFIIGDAQDEDAPLLKLSFFNEAYKMEDSAQESLADALLGAYVALASRPWHIEKYVGNDARTPAQGQPEPPPLPKLQHEIKTCKNCQLSIRSSHLHEGRWLHVGTNMLGCDKRGYRAEPAIQPVTPPSAAFLQDIRAEDSRPSCHVCGSEMVKCFGCKKCGASTLPTSVPAVDFSTDSLLEKHRAAPLGEQPRPCQMCAEKMHEAEQSGQYWNPENCPDCKGTGRAPTHGGDARALLVQHEGLRGCEEEENNAGDTGVQGPYLKRDIKSAPLKPAPADLPQAIAREIAEECGLIIEGEEKRVAALIATALAPLVAERDALRDIAVAEAVIEWVERFEKVGCKASGLTITNVRAEAAESELKSPATIRRLEDAAAAMFGLKGIHLSEEDRCCLSDVLRIALEGRASSSGETGR